MEEGLSFCGIQERFLLKDTDVHSLSMLTLAFLGDAVYTLIARSVVAGEKNRSPKEFHKRTAALINAGAQAMAFDRIKESLSPEEADILRRGRNANPATTAKHASVSDYRKATGLEALFGYLYLTDQTKRLMELAGLCLGTEVP